MEHRCSRAYLCLETTGTVRHLQPLLDLIQGSSEKPGDDRTKRIYCMATENTL